MSPPTLKALAALVAASEAVGAAAFTEAPQLKFTVYSQPVQLRYGQVFNHVQDALPLPPDVVARYADGSRRLAISGFDVDMVRRFPGGREESVKLSDHYLHHYALYLGNEVEMAELFGQAERDVMFRRMLTGCHAMKGTAVRTFQERLRARDPLRDPGLAMFGSASGAEFRQNPQRFEKPYRLLLERPSVWSPLLHIINTNNRSSSGVPSETYSPLAECPCTPQRRIDPEAGTIDGVAPDPPIECSAEFAATGNPSCSISTYVGGWRCCEHEVFLIDTDKYCSDPACSEQPADEIFMRFTFLYEDAEPATRNIEGASCCDITAEAPFQGNENIEYDIPACPAGTAPEECVHVGESVQPLAFFGDAPRYPDQPVSPYKASDLVDLVFAAPHLHMAGISITLQDAVTNETLCEVHRSKDDKAGVAYGHGDAPGDERGYLVGLSTCRWSGERAPRYRRDHPMRIRAVYDATTSHTGVMGLWLASVSPVDPGVFV